MSVIEEEKVPMLGLAARQAAAAKAGKFGEEPIVDADEQREKLRARKANRADVSSPWKQRPSAQPKQQNAQREKPREQLLESPERKNPGKVNESVINALNQKGASEATSNPNKSNWRESRENFKAAIRIGK